MGTKVHNVYITIKLDILGLVSNDLADDTIWDKLNKDVSRLNWQNTNGIDKDNKLKELVMIKLANGSWDVTDCDMDDVKGSKYIGHTISATVA